MNSKMKKLFWAAVSLLSVGTIAGCGGGGSSASTTPPPPAAISVSVSPSAAQTIDQGQSKNFTATVSNDSSSKGVNWTLTQNGTACSPGCGSISPASTASGTATTYTAPAAVNANLQFSVTATSVADTTKSASDATTAVPPPVANNPAQLPAATVGKPYSFTLTETGGVPPITWSIISGSLPAGLTLNSSTGVISGAPTGAAAATAATTARPEAMAQPASSTLTASFTAQALDSGNPQLKSAQALNLSVTPAPVPDFSISASPRSAIIFQLGSFNVYNVTVSAINGFAGTVALSASGLPANVGTATFAPASVTGFGSSTLTVVLSTTAPIFTTFTITITGTSGLTSHSTTVVLQVVPCEAVTPIMQSVAQGASTSYTASESNMCLLANATVTWGASFLSPAPSGLSVTFNPASITIPGSSTMTVTASNTASLGTFTIVITATTSSGNSTDIKVTITVTAANVAPTITSANNTPFTEGTAGTFTVTTTGTPTPALSDNIPPNPPLPSGVTFKDNGDGTGTLSGTPAPGTAGAYPITFTASNGVSPNATQNFTLTVNSASSLMITTTSLLPGTNATGKIPYSATLRATGGTPPYTWSQVGLPPGLSISTNADNTGAITGMPSRGGNFPVKVIVTDSANPTNAASRDYILLIPCIYETSGFGPANGNASLMGNFVFLFSGFDANGNAVARVGSFTADGNTTATNNGLGTVTAGEEDVATGIVSGASGHQTFLPSSSYCIGTSTGALTLNTANSSVTYSITIVVGASVFAFEPAAASFIEFDPVDNTRGSGVLKGQGAISPVTGNYVFGFSGRDSQNGPASVAGVFDVSLGTGEDDFNDPNLNIFPIPNPRNNNPISVAFAAPDLAGRTTASLMATGNGTATGDIDFVAYVVGSAGTPARATALFVVNTSGAMPGTAVPVLSGEIFSQNLPQPIDATSLNGGALFYLVGVDPSSPSSGPLRSAATIGHLSFDGNFGRPGPTGNITSAELDADIGGMISGPIVATTTGTYTVSSDGRTMFTPPAGVNFSPIAYISALDSAVLLDTGPGAGLGRFPKGAFRLTTEPSFGPIGDLPPAVANSTVTTGMPALGSTTANFIEDVDSPSSGLMFNVQAGPFPFSMLDSSNRFTVGTCPPTLSSPNCLVGYGFFGPVVGSTGEILIDETNTGTTSLQPNPFPVIIIMNEPLP